MRKLAVIALALGIAFGAHAQDKTVALYGSYKTESSGFSAETVGADMQLQREQLVDKQIGVTVGAKALVFQQDSWRTQGAQVAAEVDLPSLMGRPRVEVQVTNVSNQTLVTGAVSGTFDLKDNVSVAPEYRRELVETMTGISDGMTSDAVGSAVTWRPNKQVEVSGYGAAKHYSNGNWRGVLKARAAYKAVIADTYVEPFARFDGYVNSDPTPGEQPYYNPRSLQQITFGSTVAKRVADWGLQATAAVGPQKIEGKTAVTYNVEAKVVSPKLVGAAYITMVAGYNYDGARDNGYNTTYARLQVSIPF